MFNLKNITITMTLVSFATFANASSFILPTDDPFQIDNDMIEIERILEEERQEQLVIYNECVEDSIDTYDECMIRVEELSRTCDEYEDISEKMACEREVTQRTEDCDEELNFYLDECEELNPDNINQAPPDDNTNPPPTPIPDPSSDMEDEYGEFGPSILEEPIVEPTPEEFNSYSSDYYDYNNYWYDLYSERD
jgi:hypothetical protein